LKTYNHTLHFPTALTRDESVNTKISLLRWS